MTRHRSPEPGQDPPVTIRVAGPDDAAAVRRLAALDSGRAPSGLVLMAEEDGDPVAAISLETGSVVADPFRSTADAVHLLRLRRDQVQSGGRDLVRARSLLRRLLPGAAT